MKRSQESPVNVSSSSAALPLTGSRVSSPPPTQLASVILTGELRSASNRLLEPSIAASMASFSAAASYVTGTANGNVLSSSPAPFGAQQSKNTNNGGAATTLQVAAHQQHIFHQSLAQQQVRHSLATAQVPACSPPTPTEAQPSAHQTQQQNMQQAFQQMSAGQHGPGAQQFQRLKVEDALSYLDQVKYKFGKHPQVYNDFLDIMKEFKSQSIDTPGVIARVSSLFRGHPELIVGFNTFLPPGYKIEVQAEQVSVSVPGSLGVPAHIHHITHGSSSVTTTNIPQQQQQIEVVARSTPPGQGVSAPASTTASSASNPQMTAQQTPMAGLHSSTSAPANSSHAQMNLMAASIKEEIGSLSASVGGGTTVKPATGSPVPASGGGVGPAFGALASMHKESSASPQMGGSAAHGYANSAAQSGAAAAAAAFGVPNASQPVEFNHAINYVNKIKNRFQGQPDIYKQFLEILHTYQKEQRSLKEGLVNPLNYRPTLTEAEVYAKVAQLFQNQEDLLQEFGQFLPDATNVTRSSGGGVGAAGGLGGGAAGIASVATAGGVGGGGSSGVLSVAGGGGGMGGGLVAAAAPNTGASVGASKKSSPVAENAPSAVKAAQLTAACALGGGGSAAAAAGSNAGAGNGSSSSVSGLAAASTGAGNSTPAAKMPMKRAAPSASLPLSSPSNASPVMGGSSQSAGAGGLIPNKKPRLNSSKDYSIADVGKYGTMNELAFFDKVRRVACRSREVYDNFLRCLVMYNQEIISKMELLQITTPFLNRHPDLLKWFKDFLGLKEAALSAGGGGSAAAGAGQIESHVEAQPISLFRSRIEREMLTSKDGGKESSGGRADREREALEIDYSTCKRLGTSYCALPKSYEAPKCSGRTVICKDVLNETWVSFPSWSSEDSTFVSSRKTQYEEYIYRTEDERYELDIVLETHMSTIRVLEGVMKKLNRMSPDEAARFKLDDCLGGSSPTIHIRAIRRIYGDKASEIIEGLKRSPLVAIPVVLRRMKAKEEEWRDAQKGFNKIWREQNEKYYLKSLDHLGTNFKQNDVKALRSKALINEIETLFEERNEENNKDGAQGGRSPASGGASTAGGAVQGSGPHLKFTYKSRHKVLDDAADLLIHHAKRQTGITKEDKRRIKTLLRHSIPDMFRHPRQDLSEDEREDDDDDDDRPAPAAASSSAAAANSAGKSGSTKNDTAGAKGRNKVVLNGRGGAAASSAADVRGGSGGDDAGGGGGGGGNAEDEYTMFFANNHWYVFLRLHQILCERLGRVWQRAHQLLDEERDEAVKTQRQSRANGRSSYENVAVALRLKPRAEVDVDQYYPHFLSMVKSLLDGNMEAANYEDSLREMFGIHAYLAFTLDKVIANAVRQLVHLVTDEVCLQCTDIFLEENGLKYSSHHKASKAAQQQQDDSANGDKKLAPPGGEMSYQRRMEQLLADENLFRIVLWHKGDQCTVAVEMLDTDSHSSCSGGDVQPMQDVQNWSSYVERYVSDRCAGGEEASGEKTRRKNNDPAAAAGQTRVKKPVFLQRNLKQWERRRRKDDPAAASAAAAAAAPPPTTTTAASSAASSKAEPCSHDDSGNAKMEADDAAAEIKDVVVREDVQCIFNVNSYQMVFVANSESFLYKRHAFTRAKQCHRAVTLRMRKRFLAWQQRWGSANVSSEAETLCFNWLVGKDCDHLDMKSNARTVRVPTNVEHRAPFGTLVKYRVDYDS